ncbi:MAG: HTH-type transcriptional regulator CysB [Zoogloeaceae bacterium]|nr:HTH-type transcriptional regulator CysB [Zoogloeaceae bacterium]
MNLQQIRYVVEVSRHGMNVSEAAEALFTSQPGVSKQIRLLEEELGVDIFLRHGKRLVGLTDPGKQVLAIAERMLRDQTNLRLVGEEFRHEDEGVLSIATTHTQARYALPPVIQRFMRAYPRVRLNLHQGSPTQVCEYVLSGEADIAIATEAIAENENLVMLPCYQWNRRVIAPKDHPILKAQPLTLEEIARWPLITYDFAFTGRNQINKACLGRGLKPNVVLTAIDSDVIKTYVALGLGVGILASMAFDPTADKNLGALEAGHLFESSTTRIGIRTGSLLRRYTFAFIEFFAPALSRKVVESSLEGGGTDVGL